MTEPQEIVDLVEALLEPDWHDPACPFKDHCYCGPDDEPPPHDRVRSHLQVKAAERIKALERALTPSAATKFAYIGEFQQALTVRDRQEADIYGKFTVEWTTIKEIMKAIRDHAETLLKEAAQ